MIENKKKVYVYVFKILYDRVENKKRRRVLYEISYS